MVSTGSPFSMARISSATWSAAAPIGVGPAMCGVIRQLAADQSGWPSGSGSGGVWSQTPEDGEKTHHDNLAAHPAANAEQVQEDPYVV